MTEAPPVSRSSDVVGRVVSMYASGVLATAAAIAGLEAWHHDSTAARWLAAAAVALLLVRMGWQFRGPRLPLNTAPFARTTAAAAAGISLASGGHELAGVLTAGLVVAAVQAEPATVALRRFRSPFVSGLPGVRPIPGEPSFPSAAPLATLAAILVATLCAAVDLAPWLPVAIGVLSLGPVLLLAWSAFTHHRSTNRLAVDLKTAIRDYAPEFIVYTSRPDDASYQVSMWLPFLERSGRRFLIVTRERVPAVALGALTSHPVVQCPTIPDIESMLVPSIRAAFYVNASSGNNALVRFGHLTHVYLGHGDSDKAPSYNPTHAMYDRIFAAGPAATRRYAAHGVRIPDQKFVVVGRPQVEGIEAGVVGQQREGGPVVFYAPTWRGHVEETALSSLPQGVDIVRTLLGRGATVIFRPHPFSYADPNEASDIAAVHALLAADARATGRQHVFGPPAETERSITDCINDSDAMVSDVSSVVSDYVYSLKPMAMVSVPTATADFAVEYPIARAAYVIDGDLANIDSVLDQLLGADPMRADRVAIERDYLGDLPREHYADTFVRAVNDAVDASPARSGDGSHESEGESAAPGSATIGNPRTIANAIGVTALAGAVLGAGLLGASTRVIGVLLVVEILNVARLVRLSAWPPTEWNRLLGRYTPARSLLLLTPFLGSTEPAWSVVSVTGLALALSAAGVENTALRAWRPQGPEVHALGVADTSVAEPVSRGLLFPLSWIVTLGAWFIHVGTAGAWLWLLACAVYAVVAVLAATGGARRLRRKGLTSELLAPALDAHAPRFIVYFASTMGASYQIGMWLRYFQAIGEPFVIVTRTIRMFEEVVELTDGTIPVLNRPTLRSVGEVVRPSVHAAFYVNNAVKNTHLVERREIVHVWLNHGDSEKPACYNPVHAIYDTIFAAGQAGIDRYARHGVDIPEAKFRIVGRPQVAHLSRSNIPIGSIEDPTVLYAPTWRGPYADSRVHSIPQGVDIVTALLDRGATVIFRAHPFTYDDPDDASTIEEIGDLLDKDRAATGREHLWGAVAEQQMSVEDCFNASDAMVADVSAVVSDYLQSEKPFAMVSVGRSPQRLEAEAPAARAAYVIEDGLGNLETALDAMLGPDPMASRRRETRVYYLGDFPADHYEDGFLTAARDVIRVGAPATPSTAS